MIPLQQLIRQTFLQALPHRLPLVAVALAAGCGDPVPVPATVTISPKEGVLWALADTVRLSATAADGNGRVMEGVEFTWSSDDESVATVDAAGLVTATGNGAVQVRAEAEPVMGYATIRVDQQRGWLRAFYEATGGKNWVRDGNWVTDVPLDLWHGVATDSGENVTGLTLRGNWLTGTIPNELGNLVNLDMLDLDHNQLAGAIPPELGNLSNLRSLYLNYNELTGAIPSELGDLDSLKGLWLADNDLTGTIPPELGDLTNLEWFALSDNELTGAIPREFGTLDNLIGIGLSGNQLTGTIPPELGNLENLQALVLTDNKLTGTIPPELGDLVNLEYFWLSDNELTGAIPPELGDLVNLKWFWISDNELTGTIPPELGNLENLQALVLNNNELTGAIPPELVALELSTFHWHNTQLCAPDTEEFQEWLESIEDHEGGETCSSQSDLAELNPRHLRRTVSGETIARHHLKTRSLSMAALHLQLVGKEARHVPTHVPIRHSPSHRGGSRHHPPGCDCPAL